MHGRLPLPALFLLTIVSSLAAAELMNRFVERPTIALGRKLAALPAALWSLSSRMDRDLGRDPI